MPFEENHERDQLYQSDNLSKSQKWQITKKNEKSEQESCSYNNWHFRKAHETDQQNRFDRLSISPDSHDSRTNRRSGQSDLRANSEWCNHHSKGSHHNNRQHQNHTFKRLEEISGYENWQATTEQKQLVQKTLNQDSEERHVRPNHNKCYCISESEKWPIREDRDKNQSDCGGVTVKHNLMH